MRHDFYRKIPQRFLIAFLICALATVGLMQWGRLSPRASAADFAQTSTLRFAVIGDYGTAGNTLATIATMIKGWNPDLILTTGDNNYPQGSAETIDRNIGQYFNGYIYPYLGSYAGGATAAPNRFFPALGNHDMDSISCSGSSCSGAYLDFFTLPGNERYYDFVQGPVHFFMVNSDERELDGNSGDSVQANWLRQRLTASTARWKVVIVHHAPYTSANPNGPEVALRWPYAAWGASVVLSGHDHNYERLLIDGLPYIVNGAGGTSLYPFGTPVAGSIVRYNEDYGAMLVEANEATITFQFYNRSQQLIDSYRLPDSSPTPTPAADGIVDRQIAASADDMEEVIGTGRMVQTSTDLEMSDDSAENGIQSVGLRFVNVNIPRGATIRSAYLEFVVDESDSVQTDLQIRSHALDNSQPFTLSNFDLTARPLSAAVVDWSAIAPWTTLGALVQSPDLSSIVQEVVNRSGWQSGNALSLSIAGSGRRTAVSFDGSSSQAARLHIEWSSTPAPTVTPVPPTPMPPATALACANSGSVLREVWKNVGGTAVDDLLNDSRYPNSPNFTSELASLEVPNDWGDRYATRIRGYLCPPVSGKYTFWIASDDNSQLYLSNDQLENNKRQIASVTAWTAPRQWNRFASQKSASIYLDAAQPYYFEIMHKEGEGLDNLAVAWQGPGLSQQVIRGRYLLPYGGDSTSGTIDVRVSQGSDDVEQSLRRGILYANSYDLELGYDEGLNGDDQEVGIRFQRIMIPPGATITNAYIEFTVAEADSSRGANYAISAHAADDASPFYSDRYSLESLPRTAKVTWSVASWRRVGEKQQTSELKTVVQEVVQRSGWRSGNAITFIFDSAAGRRSAYSYNGSASRAPKLHVEWTLGTDSRARDSKLEYETEQKPNLAIDYESGAPGSLFQLSGEHFEANQQVTVLVNGSATGIAQIDGSGIFEFEIDTAGKNSGLFVVTTDAAPEEQTIFTLDDSQPLRQPINESEETASGNTIYLPLIHR